MIKRNATAKPCLNESKEIGEIKKRKNPKWEGFLSMRSKQIP